jgi:hypothetical protein
MPDPSQTLQTPEIRPRLAKLFRTYFYPPSLALRIDKIILQESNRNKRDESRQDGHLSDDDNAEAYRLFIGDSVLIMQALLQSRLLPLLDAEDIKAGNIIILKEFKIKRAKRLNGQGEVMFLGVSDCNIICSTTVSQQVESGKRLASEVFKEDQELDSIRSKQPRLDSSVRNSQRAGQLQNQFQEHVNNNSDESDFYAFETTTFDSHQLGHK